jgi:transcriptional regulator with XRE-family HTH domain
MTPEQCRAARALLDWKQDRLAEAARVGVTTIRNFENGKITPHRATLAVMQQALEAAGVEFTNGTRRVCGCARRDSSGRSAAGRDPTIAVRLPLRL